MLKRMICLLVICGLIFSVGMLGCEKKEKSPSDTIKEVKKDADKAAKETGKELEEAKEALEN